MLRNDLVFLLVANRRLRPGGVQEHDGILVVEVRRVQGTEPHGAD
jgi:hypothetical protein